MNVVSESCTGAGPAELNPASGNRLPRASRRLLWRIVLPFASGGLLLLTVGIVAAWHVVGLHDAFVDVLTWNVTSIRAAEELEIVIRETRYRLNQYLLTGDEQHIHSAVELQETTEHWIAQARRLSSTPEERQWVDQIEAGYVRFRTQCDELMQSEADTAVVRYLATDLLATEILLPARQYLDLNEQQLALSGDASRKVAERLVFGLLALGICGAVSGLVVGYGLARGISRSILLLSIPVRDVAGQLNEVVGPLTVSADPRFEDLEQILRVVSDRVALVIAQLQDSQRAVQRNEQLASLGQFSAGLAHELRNPLMSMKILVEAALEEGDGAALSDRDLAVVLEEIRRLEQLVQGFLDFARPPQAEFHTVNLAAVIGPAVDLISPQALRRGVRVEWSCPEDCPEADADAGQLRQVVLNLLLNALDHAPTDSSIVIEAGSESGNATIRVLDDGPGIPAELRESIFEPFVSTRETGLGLGLSICRRIIDTHGGTIAVRNRSPHGAEFVVTIPREQPVSVAGIQG